jgi:glycosyltransferase involved in cell wall biosynthesis
MTSGTAFSPDLPLIVVPVFNHASSLPDVVRGVLRHSPHVLAVDDGSTDLPARNAEPGGSGFPPVPDAGQAGYGSPFVPDAGHPLYGLPVLCMRSERNLGKGAAVLAGAAAAARMGMTHILTIDADGQHDPDAVPAFIVAARADPRAIIVGERDFATCAAPLSSRFGRSFSNFWYTVQTGARIGDMQSGMRLYPLAVLNAVPCAARRYAFEVEVLVRASWAGFTVKGIPVRVFYPPAEKRVSHFRPLADNLRIAVLNTRLTMRSLIPWPHKHGAGKDEAAVSLRHPLRSLRLLAANDAAPEKLALGAAVGAGISTLPLIGLHSILIIIVSGALRLNKTIALAAGQLGMPPFVPALCIEAGHYLRHGYFLTEISMRTLGYEALERLGEWIIGSLVVAPFSALLCGMAVWAPACALRRSFRKQPGRDPGRQTVCGEKTP